MSTPPVNHDEILYRQVSPKAKTPLYVDLSVTPPVHRLAFKPNEHDADGLSLLRGRFRALAWAGYRPERPDVPYYAVRLIASHLISIAESVAILDLRFGCSPDSIDSLTGEPYSHCTAVQINRTDYDKGGEAQQRIKGWMEKVSEMARPEDVFGPLPKPSDDVPIRPTS